MPRLKSFLGLPLARQLTVAMTLYTLACALPLLILAHNNVYSSSKQALENVYRDMARDIVRSNDLLNTELELDIEKIDEIASQVHAMNPILYMYVLDSDNGLIFLPKHLEPGINDGEPHRHNRSWNAESVHLSRTMHAEVEPSIDQLKRELISAYPISFKGDVLGIMSVGLMEKSLKAIFDDINKLARVNRFLIIMGFLIFMVLIACKLIRVLIEIPVYKLESTLQKFVNSDFKLLDEENEEIVRAKEITNIYSDVYNLMRLVSKQYGQLKAIDHQRRELVAHVSHDLRTPLAAISGYVERLISKEQEGALQPGEGKKYLEVVKRQMELMSARIDTLFDLTRLDAGRFQAYFEPFGIWELISDISMEFRLDPKNRDVELEVQMQVPEDCTVYGDIALVQRVFENLIKNALRYRSSEGGKITISVTPDTGEQPKIVVSVCDNGEGICTERLKAIKNHFLNAPDLGKTPDLDERKSSSKHNGRKIESKRAGLGLLIIQRILELHDCGIDVDSEEGKGTCFTFQLPTEMFETDQEKNSLSYIDMD